MELDDLKKLRYFSETERALDGKEVIWSEYDLGSMLILDEIRHRLGSPVQLIRGNHGEGKETAIDWAATGIPYPMVAMECLRFGGIGLGLYTGRSVHIDRRPASAMRGARWLAFRPHYLERLEQEKLDHLIVTRPTDSGGWMYLQWSHPESWKALALLFHLTV